MSNKARRLKTLAEARQIIHQALPERFRTGRFITQTVPLVEAVGLALAEDINCPIDLPTFDRSIMDGFAVRAEDTFGASEGLPAYLQLVGEVRMGEEPAFTLSPQQTASIPTGGMLPPSAHSFVMVEHTQSWGENTVEVLRPVAPGDNTVHRGDDICAGDVLLHAGHLLRPQDISALAGIGLAKLPVRKPRVAILSTGNELLSPEEPLTTGRIYDMNGPALQASVRQEGAESSFLGLLPDDPQQITAALARALPEVDMILVSGGTSVGAEDLLHDIIDSLGSPGVLIHGLAMKPGKPVIVGLVGEVPIFGLPGHPTSCLIIFREVVAPLLRTTFRKAPFQLPLQARLSCNFPSQAGREEIIPVTISRDGESWMATPVYGPSALVVTLIRADGLVRIPMASEGLYLGDEIEVEPFR